MSNRIDPMDQGLLGKIANKAGETDVAKKPDLGTGIKSNEVSHRASSGETVELTSGAKLLERLEKTLASIPDVDSERIAVVKAQIENGDYQIDADKIAAAMLRMDQELDTKL